MQQCMLGLPLFWPKKLYHSFFCRYLTMRLPEVYLKAISTTKQRRYCSKISGSEQQANFVIRLAKAEDKTDLKTFLKDNYYNEEPLSVSMEPKGADPKDLEFIIGNLDHGCSLLATQRLKESCDEKDMKVGALISGPKYLDDLVKLCKEADKFRNTKWGHIMRIIAHAESDANVFERYQVCKVMHAHALAVHRQTRGKNLGINLLKELMKLSKTLGYEVITIDCSSFYSAKLCDRLGWDCINTLYYSDYLDDNNKQVFRPEAPHCAIKTYAVRL